MEFKFIPLDAANRPDWDRFVAENPHAWVGHDTAHIDFEESLGHASVSHLVLDNRDSLIGVAPLFLLDYCVGRVFRFRAMATGTLLRGAPLLAADMQPKTRRDFWHAWAQWARAEAAQRGIDEIRVNFPHFIGQQHVHDFYGLNPLRELGFQDVPNLTLLLDLTATGEDLLASFESNCRNKYRKAAAAGAQWEPTTSATSGSPATNSTAEFEEEETEPFSRRTMRHLDRFVARAWRAWPLMHDGFFLSRACGRNVILRIQLDPVQPAARTLTVSTNLFIGQDIEYMRRRGIQWCELGSLESTTRHRTIAAFNAASAQGHHSMDCRLPQPLSWRRPGGYRLGEKSENIRHRQPFAQNGQDGYS